MLPMRWMEIVMHRVWGEEEEGGLNDEGPSMESSAMTSPEGWRRVML
jgi:hypothetical protein